METQENTSSKSSFSIEEIYVGYYEKMVLYAQKILESNLYAEDVVQDVFTGLYQQQVHFIAEAAFITYVFRSIHNRCIDMIRRKQLNRNYEDIYLEEYKSKASSENNSLYYNELSAIVENRIEKLPKKCRQIFIMKYRNENTNPEISESLGLSVKTIENQVFIARSVLRNYLQSYLCS